MGQAKNRAERRREQIAAGKALAQYAAQIPKLRLLDAVAVDPVLLRTEHAAFCERSGYAISQHDYAESLLTAALERERQTREKAEERERMKDNLVQPATHVPPEMAQAAARLQALKAGA